jgi:hypothetical protein
MAAKPLRLAIPLRQVASGDAVEGYAGRILLHCIAAYGVRPFFVV